MNQDSNKKSKLKGKTATAWNSIPQGPFIRVAGFFKGGGVKLLFFITKLAELPPEIDPRLPCRNFPEYYFIVLRFLPPLRNTFDFPKILIFDLQPQPIKVPRVKKSFRSQCRTTISLTPKIALGANLAHFFKHFEKPKNRLSFHLYRDKDYFQISSCHAYVSMGRNFRGGVIY